MKTLSRKLIIACVIIVWIIGGLFTSAHAQSPQTASGLSWLSATQSQDGHWTGIETTDYHSTAEVLATLSILQSNDSSYINGLNWLNLQTVNDTHYLSERISINGGAYSAEDLSAMLSYRQADGGFGGFSEYLSNNRHTARALLALKSANYTDSTVINNALNYLISTQNTDGGFGFYSGDDSNVYMTALISYTLQQFPQTVALATAINKATTYIISNQQLDGSFGPSTGSGQGSIYETAYAYIALIAVSTDGTVLGNAVNYLTTTQSATGNWNNDPYSTALALMALYYSQNKPTPPPAPPAKITPVNENPSATETTVTGKVTDASTGYPVLEADITVIGTNLSTKTDSTGAYTLRGVTDLAFGVRALATGYDSLAYNITTTAYGTYIVDFALNPSQIGNLKIASLTTDRGSYSANTNAVIQATIENTGTTQAEALIIAQIKDNIEEVVAIVSPSNPQVSIPSLSSVNVTLPWNTGQFNPGDYQVILKVINVSMVGDGIISETVLAEKGTILSIVPNAQLSGGIALNPPTILAASTPVSVNAIIRNTGNVPIIMTSLRLIATLQDQTTPVYTMEKLLETLPVNNVAEIDFGSFIPSAGGNYIITVMPAGTDVSGALSKTLYVGPYASATFTVSPEMTLPGDVDVKGTIHITGTGASVGMTTQDPLVPLIKDAIQKGVNYEQTTVIAIQNANNYSTYNNWYMNQAEALYGLETSNKIATVDPAICRVLFDFLTGLQRADGSVGWQRPNGSIAYNTFLALRAYASWYDNDEAKPYILKASDYLLTQQSTYDLLAGSWQCNLCGGWWGGRDATTATVIIGILKAYELSKDSKYITPIHKAVEYLLSKLSNDNYNDNITHPYGSIHYEAIKLVALQASLPVISDQSYRDYIADVINTRISVLKSLQRADGGWAVWNSNLSSDPLTTSIMIYAMAKIGINKEDPVLRKAIIYLLNHQAADGSWSGGVYFPTNLAVTTWAMISMPLAFEKIGGIDTDLYLTLPDDVVLNSSNPVPTDSSAGSYHWKIPVVLEEGKDVSLDLTVKSLLLGETRNVAQSASLTFKNTYTNETVTIPIDTPTVTGVAPVAIDVTTDKVEYTANEDVTITSLIASISPDVKNPYVKITIEDSQENLVAQVTEFPVNNLNPSTTQTYVLTWNTTTTLSNSYLVRARLYENGAFLTEDTRGIAILPDKTITSKVTTDKATYNANEQVIITSTTQSLTPNYIFSNLSAKITIKNSQGTSLLTDTKPIPILTTDQLTELKTYWDTGVNPEGTYTITLEALEGATIISASQTTFKILGSSNTGAGLAGTITAQLNPVYQGKDEIITYSVINNGNEDIANFNIKVLIVDPETQEVKETVGSQRSAVRGETITAIHTISTNNRSPKTYLAILQVEVGSNILTLASATFEVLPGIEIKASVPDYARMLVWLNDGCEKDSGQGSAISGRTEEKCIRKDLIEKALAEIKVTYNIVTDKQEFQKELRNNYYTDVMILGNFNPLQDHYGEELRERVYSGKGLITSPWIGESEGDMLGLKVQGKLSQRDNIVEISEGDIFRNQLYQSSGEALKIEASPDNVLGWITYTTNKGSSKYPAVVKKEYGDGKTIYFAFDLGLSAKEASYAQFIEIVRAILNYIHTPENIPAYYPYDLVPLRIDMKSLGAEFDLKTSVSYPQEVKLFDPLTSAWVTENPWEKEVHLDANETKNISLFALTPDAVGTYTITTDVKYLEDGAYKPYQTLSTEMKIEKDAYTLTTDILYKLATLYPASEGEMDKLSVSRVYLETVRDRTILDSGDINSNIHDILKAIEATLKITSVDIKEIRLDMDRLLGIYGEMAYLNP